MSHSDGWSVDIENPIICASRTRNYKTNSDNTK